MFFATPTTAAALAAARRVALLIGGYDGSGNFGDIAQLDVTMETLGPLADDLLLLPVLERSRLADHAEQIARMRQAPAQPLFFDPGEGNEDELVAVTAPPELDFAACVLYGGGYLNRQWGRRKLLMLAAAEQLIAGAGEVRRLASGLQVEREWLADLPAEDHGALAAFELFGSRDPTSRQALAELFPRATVFESGDDAIGVLGQAQAAPPPADGGRLRVNLHFSENDFVTSEAGSMAAFYLAFLAELERHAGRPISAQPLIAYLDRHLDESPGVERLAAACEAAGIEVAEPLLLGSADYERAGAEIGAASLTLSCSYHVALASLMAAVPTVGIRENSYYDQKVEGLREHFGLPPEFAIDTSTDPAEGAARIAATVLDERRGAALRAGLQEGARTLRERHQVAAARLRGRVDPAGPRHQIAELTRKPGELSFEARIDGESTRVWFRTATEVTPPADAALAACLVPAMRSGGSLSVPGPVSPRLLRSQREYQAIQRAWSLDWDFGQLPLREIEVEAERPLREPAPSAEGRVAAFFSGGVDSWATVLANPDLTDLIFVRGLDLVPTVPQHAALAEEVERRLGEAAAKLGLTLHVVETNVRELSDPLIRWEAYNPSAMIAVALFFEPLFERVLIASDTDHATQPPVGTSRMVDQLWSTEALEIVDDGGRLNREQRIRLIADNPIVQETLRVCWENAGGAYNCGHCRKCLLTLIPLEALGVRERFSSFPAELDLDLLDGFAINSPISLALWEDVLDTTRSAGREDLEEVVAALVARGKRGFGLPQSYRGRRDQPGASGLVAALREADRRGGEAEREAAAAQAQLDAVLNSRSWRLAAPLRRLGARLRARRGRA